MKEKIDDNKIKSVLNAMIGSIEKENVELYKKLSESIKYEADKDSVEDFDLKIIHPFKSYVKGLITVEISEDRDVQFILMNYNFIERNFKNLIETIEGSACCADKSRTIVKRLYHYFRDGKQIEFDYSGEYTYHLPKIIFKTHDDIIKFYIGLKDIFYGDYRKYIQALDETLKSAKKS